MEFIYRELGDFLSDEVKTGLKEIIDSVSATKSSDFEIVFDPTLVRGMSYYTGTIFEIAMPELGIACGGGGRYDKMIGKFTGKDTPACGFSIGFERIVLLLLESGFQVPNQNKKIAYLIEKGVDSSKLCDIIAEAQKMRGDGTQVLVARMNKNKKFQKETLEAQGYEEFRNSLQNKKDKNGKETEKMAESMQGLKRSHRCTEVSSANIGEVVTVMGWVQKRRNLGSLIFVDLRDRSGLLQIVFDENDVKAEGFAKAGTLRSEYVIAVEGKVTKREGAVNENLATGEIEVRALSLRILSESETPPFPIEENISTKEELRLKYRFLDLRRPDMQRNLLLRSKIAILTRQFLAEEGFLEIETPTLIKSTRRAQETTSYRAVYIRAPSTRFRSLRSSLSSC